MKMTLRSWLLLVSVQAWIASPGFAQTRAHKYLLFVGTYTSSESQDTGSKGIYSYRFDESSGKLAPLGVAAETANPSFLAVAPGNKFLYAVNELQTYKGAPSGAVTAFTMDHQTGKLTQLDEVASRGADPCYISFDRTGKYLLVANYTGGTNKQREEHSHAHWIEASAGNRFAYVADLGLDRVLIYKFDPNKGALIPGESRPGQTATNGAKDFFSATLAPGTGPRHVAFSRDGKFMYVLGEVDSTVTVLANESNETFKSIQKISALPAGFSGKNDAAEIVMHPGGKFLYSSNRGDDSIAVFTVNRKTGKLTFTQRVPSGGKTPRNFAIDPSGSKLLAANEESGNIVEFRINRSTGKLTTVGEVAKVPAPVCLVFVPE